MATRRWPLRSLIVLPFLAQILAITGLVGYISYRNGQRTVDELAEQLTHEISGRIDENLQGYLAPVQQIDRLNALLIEGQRLPVDDLTPWEKLLWRQVQTNTDINFIKITNPLGQQRTGERFETGELRINVIDTWTNSDFHSYSTDDQGDRISLATRFPTEDTREGGWYKDGVAAGQSVWSSVFISYLEDTLLVASSTPVYDLQTKDLKAVLNTAVRLNSVGHFLEELSIGKSGQAFLIERRQGGKGNLLASSTGEIPFVGQGDDRTLFPAIQSRDPITRSAMAALLESYPQLESITEPTFIKFHTLGEWRYFQVHPLTMEPQLDWLIAVVVPQADFTAQIQRNARDTILLSLGALGLASLGGLLMARWITAPLERLAQASREIATGQWENTAELTQKLSADQGGIQAAEVAHLAQNFQAMATQLKGLFSTLEQRVADRTHELHQANANLQREQEKAEQLLLNILPGAIADKLKESPGTIAELFEEVTILFADIVDFTPLSNRMEPLEMVGFLNRVFSTFDALAEKHGLEKIKTIGDAYMVVAGLPTPRTDHAQAIADMALDMQIAVRNITDDLGAPCQVRIGINSGIVVAGVIGTSKFIYDLWGDAVNVASRMESHGAAGRIHLTASTYEQLKDSHDLIPRGSIYIKGKGNLQTYWLVGRSRRPALLGG